MLWYIFIKWENFDRNFFIFCNYGDANRRIASGSVEPEALERISENQISFFLVVLNGKELFFLHDPLFYFFFKINVRLYRQTPFITIIIRNNRLKSQGFEIKETFLEKMKNKILSILDGMNISIEKCICQGYDGANVMVCIKK